MKHASLALLFAGALAGPAFAQNNPNATPVQVPPTALAVASTNALAAIDAKFKGPLEKNSYSIGVMLANDMKRNLQRGGYEVDPAIVAQAFTAFFTGQPTTVTEAEAQTVVRAYSMDLRQKAEEKRKAETEKNKTEGEAFLAANKAKEGVITLPSGLQYKVLTPGTGPKPTTNDTVSVHYRGTLIDGTEFDSSLAKGQPATFPVTRVIKGWTEALQLMPTGSKWQLTIPGELAYGQNGSPPKIGPNSVLQFEVELLGIKEPVNPPPQPVVTSDIIKVPSKAELEKGAKIEVIKPADLERLQKEEAAKKAAAEKK
jgi:FKBP-type peptidyl-prolyl cis-trans isomerase FklB